MLIACLVVEITQCWFVCLCQPTVSLHQGQGHRIKREDIYATHKSTVYRYARFGCCSLNTVRDMAIIGIWATQMFDVKNDHFGQWSISHSELPKKISILNFKKHFLAFPSLFLVSLSHPWTYRDDYKTKQPPKPSVHACMRAFMCGCMLTFE